MKNKRKSILKIDDGHLKLDVIKTMLSDLGIRVNYLRNEIEEIQKLRKEDARQINFRESDYARVCGENTILRAVAKSFMPQADIEKDPNTFRP